MQLKQYAYKALRKIGRLPFIKLFAFFFVEICGGYRIYRRLRKKYGMDCVFLTCQHRGTGDVYNIGSYLSTYLKKNRIEKYQFLYRGRSEQKVGALFNISGNTILSEREMLRLLRFQRFVGSRDVNIIQLHHCTTPDELRFNRMFFEEYYKGISFVDTFKLVTMGLPSKTKPNRPQFHKLREIQEIFKKNGLIPGRTVILSPYSSSAQILNAEMWGELVEKLKARGYTAATNCAPEIEQPLAGTVGLSIDYKYLASYLECAGFFVGARSGLCDVINTIPCRKIILTPHWAPNLQWRGTPGKTMRFYGIWPNYGRNDTVELEYAYDFNRVKLIPDKVTELLDLAENQAHEIKVS